ncbi:hypothetical protein K0M31_012908, partial [Melipona bicolor]
GRNFETTDCSANGRLFSLNEDPNRTLPQRMSSVATRENANYDPGEGDSLVERNGTNTAEPHYHRSCLKHEGNTPAHNL